VAEAAGWGALGTGPAAPDPDSAWAVAGWVAVAEPAAVVAEVGARGVVAAPEGAVRVVAAACGNLGVWAVEVGELAAAVVLAAPAEDPELAAVVLAGPVDPVELAVEAAPAEDPELAAVVVLAAQVGPVELEAEGDLAVVAAEEDLGVELNPVADPERAPEWRAEEAKRIRRENG
jgi:hypothetical protein